MYFVGQEKSMESIEMHLDPTKSCITPFELPTAYQHTPVCPTQGKKYVKPGIDVQTTQKGNRCFPTSTTSLESICSS